MVKTTGTAATTWTFRARFRRSAFSWKGSKFAIQRIHEALAEIRAVSRQDQATAAEGAVLFLEKALPCPEPGRQFLRRPGQRHLRRRSGAGPRHRQRAGGRRRAQEVARPPLRSYPGRRSAVHRAPGRPLGGSVRDTGARIELGRRSCSSPGQRVARTQTRHLRLLAPRSATAHSSRPAATTSCSISWPWTRIRSGSTQSGAHACWLRAARSTMPSPTCANAPAARPAWRPSRALQKSNCSRRPARRGL